MARKFIDDAWQSYVVDVLRHETGVLRLYLPELRRAFYAGAKAAVDVCIRDIDPDADEAQAEAAAEAILRELNEFTAAVRAGRA